MSDVVKSEKIEGVKIKNIGEIEEAGLSCPELAKMGDWVECLYGRRGEGLGNID